jgi:leucyl aminopeptidase
MELIYLPKADPKKTGDLLVFPFWKKANGVESASPLNKKRVLFLQSLLALGDFRGKEGEVLFFYLENEAEKRGCLLGLGSKERASSETLRRSYGALTKNSIQKRLKSLHLLIPSDLDENHLKGMVEGLLLPNYLFHGLKNFKHEDVLGTIQKAVWIGQEDRIAPILKKTQIVCEAINYARDLINGNADTVTPQYLSHCARLLIKNDKAIQGIIFDRKRIEKEKMGLLLAVNRGSSLDPSFIILNYRGNPRSKEKTVIVGKGVTYDTGGLNLKQVSGGMDGMRADMAGAAICLAVIKAAGRLKLRKNVTAVIPCTENCTDAKSYKPGDVYTSYSGKTVEMTNADAEGRLILADAISYAIKNLHPTRIIDIATLTGAVEIALGSEAAGLMSPDEALTEALIQSGERTFERVWQMPLFEEYKDRLKSDIADIKNWNGRGAAASLAATFIRSFVGDAISWAHIDMAGTAFSTEAKKYLPKYATGFGIRLFIDFLENN